MPQQSLEKFDEEWRQLEDEHNDLLALLAQQELEKTAMAELLSSRIGPEAVVEVKEKARVDCEARYGSYVDYAQASAMQRAEEERRGTSTTAQECDVNASVACRGRQCRRRYARSTWAFSGDQRTAVTALSV